MRAGQPQYHGPHGAFMGELLRREGDLDGARAVVAAAAPLLAGDTVRVARLAALGARIEADEAARARDLGRTDDAAEAAARAARHADEAAAVIGPRSKVERAYATVAAAYATCARGDDARDQLREAIERFEELGHPHPAALMRMTLAEDALRAGDRDEAAHYAGKALESASEMGAHWLAREARSFLVRARLRAARGLRRRARGRRGCGRGPVRPDAARARGARDGRRGRDEPRDRRAAVHGREDRERPRVADPRQARRTLAHGGRGGRTPPRARAVGYRPEARRLHQVAGQDDPRR